MEVNYVRDKRHTVILVSCLRISQATGIGYVQTLGALLLPQPQQLTIFQMGTLRQQHVRPTSSSFQYPLD